MGSRARGGIALIEIATPKEPTVKKTVLTLPSHWASYLVNGDASGLSDGERKQCEKTVARHGRTVGQCASCGDEYFARDSDADLGAGMVCPFFFLYYRE